MGGYKWRGEETLRMQRFQKLVQRRLQGLKVVAAVERRSQRLILTIHNVHLTTPLSANDAHVEVTRHLNIIIQVFQKESHASPEIAQQQGHNRPFTRCGSGGLCMLRGATTHGPAMLR